MYRFDFMCIQFGVRHECIMKFHFPFVRDMKSKIKQNKC